MRDRREYPRSVDQHEWRRRVLPGCLGKAQEAVARLRSQGVRADLNGEWLVFDLRAVEGKDPDAWVAALLDRVWPRWRECVRE